MTFQHPFSDEYADWSEANACQACDGLGEHYIEGQFDPYTGDYGMLLVCPRCGGSGIDPSAEVIEDCDG